MEEKGDKRDELIYNHFLCNSLFVPLDIFNFSHTVFLGTLWRVFMVKCWSLVPSNSRMFSFPLATELSVLCGLHKRCFPQSARMFAYMQKNQEFYLYLDFWVWIWHTSIAFFFENKLLKWPTFIRACLLEKMTNENLMCILFTFPVSPKF